LTVPPLPHSWREVPPATRGARATSIRSTDLHVARTPGLGAPAGAAANQAAVSPAELEWARKAYRRALESDRAWRAFSAEPRHHDATYWTLLVSLFVEPGMNRTTLIERVTAGAGVSRSTAERAIRDARASGLVCHRQVGTEVLMELSERLFAHCLGFFRSRMDQVRFGEGLGEDGGHRG
jgi:hypothetical protein